MTDDQIKHLTQLQELREKGVLSEVQFEKEKTKILGDAVAAVDSDDEAFTEVLSSRAMREVFDAYDIEKLKLRKSFVYRYYKRARNFSLSVNKRIPKKSKLDESVGGPELIGLVALEYRNAGFQVLEQPNHIKVWLNAQKLVAEGSTIDKLDMLGVVVFVTREKTWQVTGRFDADVYRSKLNTIGMFWAFFVLFIIGLVFWPILICALCVGAGMFTSDEKKEVEAVKQFAQKPLDNVLENYVVADI